LFFKAAAAVVMVFETKNEDEEEEGGSEEEWRGGGGSRVFGSAEGQADYIITGGWVCVPHPRGFRSGESLLSLSLSPFGVAQSSVAFPFDALSIHEISSVSHVSIGIPLLHFSGSTFCC
jgi:hypothetical protein